jgi:hypothetical protein
VEVGEQRKGDAAEAVRPIVVAVAGVDADTQNLGIRGEEAVAKRFDAGNLAASRRSEVERIEQQHDMPLALELIEADFT